MKTQNDILELFLDDNLFAIADKVRAENVGDIVHLRGLIEFSNICKNNCLYCGIRKDNQNIKRYRLAEDNIISLAEHAVQHGFRTIVMQSGEDGYFDTKKMQYIISAIKKLGVAVTLSIGEKTFDEYKAYRDAGADRYLLRIETTGKQLYQELNPNMSWDNRRQCLADLKKLGYEVGSGIMVGLPEQSLASIADDLLFLQNIGIDMAGIGPFIPHPDTPLKHSTGGTLDLALRTMAIMRILLPKINIPATTAMETLHPDGRIMALKCGANVVMPNINNTEYKKLYEIYPGKETVSSSFSEITHKIQNLGRRVL